MENVFSKFSLKTKKIRVKALNDAEVTIQELNVGQSTDFYKKLIDGIDDEGNAKLNVKELAEIKLEKVACSLIDPAMTIDQLKGLSDKATEAIDEIAVAIDNFEVELKK